MGEVQPPVLTREKRVYYRLHALVVWGLLFALLSLATRPTAWGGWSVTIVCMSVFFVYHFLTRVQLGLLEFAPTTLFLGHALILTVKYLWPILRGSEGIHAAARATRADGELIAHAAQFGAPADPIAPDPRAAL